MQTVSTKRVLKISLPNNMEAPGKLAGYESIFLCNGLTRVLC